MYARAVTIQMKPGTDEEATRIYRDSIVPAARTQRGFRGATLLSDPESGNSISITFWETEADLKASEESGYFQEQLGKITPLAAGAPERKVYRVNVRAEAAPAHAID